ncbi:hypothetical protein [Halobacillus sp. A5]|uniref:hypothetical protein n=1 Tax=Halobacillus sp. A5 TaxID=2880263 RepID=UPI0020A6898D|nr:hypothetical protein [Halobacillus sp. A5]MCP3029215.1 hypothetical protein [Halobacillus sp. A5]
MAYSYYLSDDDNKKKKFNIVSLVLFVIFIALFTLMVSGFSFWGLGRAAVILMLLFPIGGIVTGVKGGGWKKWLLILVHAAAFIMMVFILLNALGIA